MMDAQYVFNVGELDSIAALLIPTEDCARRFFVANHGLRKLETLVCSANGRSPLRDQSE